jgi:hypothetical protein
MWGFNPSSNMFIPGTKGDPVVYIESGDNSSSLSESQIELLFPCNNTNKSKIGCSILF